MQTGQVFGIAETNPNRGSAAEIRSFHHTPQLDFLFYRGMVHGQSCMDKDRIRGLSYSSCRSPARPESRAAYHQHRKWLRPAGDRGLSQAWIPHQSGLAVCVLHGNALGHGYRRQNLSMCLGLAIALLVRILPNMQRWCICIATMMHMHSTERHGTEKRAASKVCDYQGAAVCNRTQSRRMVGGTVRHKCGEQSEQHTWELHVC